MTKTRSCAKGCALRRPKASRAVTQGPASPAASASAAARVVDVSSAARGAAMSEARGVGGDGIDG